MSQLRNKRDLVMAALSRIDDSVIAVHDESLKLLEKCIDAQKKILIFGNGGSAADAQHFAAELVSSLHGHPLPRPVSAISLSTDTSVLTAIANDSDFNEVFRRQVEAIGDGGDLAIGLSTSGNSENVIQGLEQAQSMGLDALAICGRNGMSRQCADVELRLPSNSTQEIQSLTLVVIHSLCESLEPRRNAPNSLP